MDALDLGAHLDAQLGVEVGERLVEQQQPRLQHQRAGDRDALLLAAGELRGIALAEPGSCTSASIARTRSSISAAGRRWISRPNATLSNTVMCGNSA